MPYRRVLRFSVLATIAVAGAFALNHDPYTQTLWLLCASIVIFGLYGLQV